MSAINQTVPIEPTNEMIDAGLRATASFLDIEGSQLTVNREKMRRRYKAMIDASITLNEIKDLQAVNKILRTNLNIAYDAMKSAIKKCQATIEECLSENEVVKNKRLAIFGDLDIPLAQIGCTIRTSDEALAEVERQIELMQSK